MDIVNSRKIVWPLLVVAGGVVLFIIFRGEKGLPSVTTVREHMAAEQLELGDPIVNSVGMVLVPIPAGEFQMGTPIPKSNPPRHLTSEIPQHLVKITKPYYLSVCEVTQQQYQKVMGERPWAGKPLVRERSNCAATYISWKNAVEFCVKLSELESTTYRLPTEAEWECACRAGTITAYSFGNDSTELETFGWYDRNAYKDGGQYAHAVGQKRPNAWGLYDMHGNVWEWCQDWYAGYDSKKKNTIDPTGPKKGRVRVWRGGGFADSALNLRCATRLSFGRVGYRPGFAAGFRVVKNMETD